MALDTAQLESVREMVGDKLFSTIQSLCAGLNAAQESAMSDDIDEWDRIKNKHVKMSGGSDGIDIDNERARNALKRRVRQRLDLPVASSSGGIFQIPVGIGYENACDW
jgi:hypothetical protein